MSKINFRLIVISDRRLIPDGDIVRVFSSCAHVDGIAFELREKDLSGEELLLLAKALRVILPPPKCLLINGSVETAREVKCGVHLTESHKNISQARKRLEGEAVIGVSTHSLAQSTRAEEEGADYIMFGPVYDTPSKRKFGAPQGIEKLKEVTRSVSVPVFAIGGLTPDRMKECRDAGAYGGACISYILAAHDPAQAAQAMMDRAI